MLGINPTEHLDFLNEIDVKIKKERVKSWLKK